MKTFWNTITSDDVAARFNAAEMDALKAVQGAQGDSGLANTLQDVINSVRGQIKQGNNQLGPDGTIPDSLRRDVIAVARWDWLVGFAKNERLQTEGRKRQAEKAEDRFDKIARGELKVELPDPGVTDQTSAPINAIQVATKENRRFTRHNLDAI